MQKQIISEIVACIKSYHPIIYINSNDENRVNQILEYGFSEFSTKPFRYIPHIDSTKEPYSSGENYKGLDEIIKDKLEGYEGKIKQSKLGNEEYSKENELLIFVFHNIEEDLKNKRVISIIKDLSLKTLYDDSYSIFFFIISPIIYIPKELEKLVTIIDVPNPDDEDIKEIIGKLIDNNLKEVSINDNIIKKIIKSLKGLSEIEIKKILNISFQKRGIFDDKSIKEIIEQKKQIIRKSNLLELIENKEDKNIGGVKNLINWLERKKIVLEKIDQGKKLDAPKGLLLVGVPGSGKSLAAQATANILGIPLLKLELGKILDKYVGESESNFHEAIRLAEAMSPCILWIDELEKAFVGAGSGGDSNGTTTRIFGFFLTWLQEKTKTIFIIATANNINNIPPEFSRKGRFDKIFYLGCPGKEQILEILKIHLKKRITSKSYDNLKDFFSSNILDDSLVGVMTGADIESIVQESIEDNEIDGEKYYGRDLEYFLEKNIKKFADSKNLEVRKKKNQEEKIELFSKYDITDAS